MNLERANAYASTLVPLCDKAVPTHIGNDKGTRKMHARLELLLQPSFDLQVRGDAIQYRNLRFVNLEAEVGGKLKVALRSTEQYQLLAGRPLELVSGICLFGASDLSAQTTNGDIFSLVDPPKLAQLIDRQVEDVWAVHFLHPSEAENILRITDCLKILSATYRGDTISCTFHLPEAEYCLYMLDLYHQGVISLYQFSKLIEYIKNRAVGLARLIRKRIPVAVAVSFSSPLEPYISTILQENQSLAEIKESIQADPVLYNLMISKPPTNLTELAQLSYAAQYIRSSTAGKATGRNVLAVETFEEIPVFDHAVVLGQAIDQSLGMMAMYLPPSSITTNNPRSADLFWHQGTNRLRDLKQVIINRRG